MKKVVASVSYDNYLTINHGPRKFGVHIDEVDYSRSFIPVPRFQISEIHPYDDAKYTWAKRSDNNSNIVLFINDGKVIDKMHLWSYEPDDYENFDDYLNDILDDVAVELMSINSDVKPRMIHN